MSASYENKYKGFVHYPFNSQFKELVNYVHEMEDNEGTLSCNILMYNVLLHGSPPPSEPVPDSAETAYAKLVALMPDFF